LIVVYTPSGERVPVDGNRYKTDEHNNLEVLSGPQNSPNLVACFNTQGWDRVVVEDAEKD
jgi:hypothetical protein